jgi:hypothetical protein
MGADSNDYNFYNELTSIMDISAIVHKEQYRIDQKAVGIHNALDSQNRLIFLNQSYASRMKEYSFMIMIIALTIVIIVFILMFKDFLPSALVNIIVLIVGSIGGIWALWIFWRIQNRDNVDFDKVYSIPPSDLDNSGNVFVNSRNANNSNGLLSVKQVCAGQDCCDATTTTYIDGQCRTSSSSFTSIEQAYNNGELTKNILQNYNFTNKSLIFSSYP